MGPDLLQRRRGNGAALEVEDADGGELLDVLRLGQEGVDRSPATHAGDIPPGAFFTLDALGPGGIGDEPEENGDLGLFLARYLEHFVAEDDDEVRIDADELAEGIAPRHGVAGGLLLIDLRLPGAVTACREFGLQAFEGYVVGLAALGIDDTDDGGGTRGPGRDCGCGGGEECRRHNLSHAT